MWIIKYFQNGRELVKAKDRVKELSKDLRDLDWVMNRLDYKVWDTVHYWLQFWIVKTWLVVSIYKSRIKKTILVLKNKKTGVFEFEDCNDTMAFKINQKKKWARKKKKSK